MVSPQDRMTLPDAMLSPFFDPLLEKEEEGDGSVPRLLGGESSLEREIGEFQKEYEQERRDISYGDDRDGSISRMSHRDQDEVVMSHSSDPQEDSSFSNQKGSSQAWDSRGDARHHDGDDSMMTDLMASSPWKNENISVSQSLDSPQATSPSRSSIDRNIPEADCRRIGFSSKPHPYHPRRSSPLKPRTQPSNSLDDDETGDVEDSASIPSELSSPSATPIKIPPRHSSPAPAAKIEKVNSLLEQTSPLAATRKLPPRTPPAQIARPLSIGNSPRPRSPTLLAAASPIAESTASASRSGNRTPLRSALRNAAFAAARKLSPNFRHEIRSPTADQLLQSPSSVRSRGIQGAPAASEKNTGNAKQALRPSPALPSSPVHNAPHSRAENPTAASLAKRHDAPAPPQAFSPSRRERTQMVAANGSPNSTRKRTVLGLRDAVRSAERRAVSPPASQASSSLQQARRNTVEDQISLYSTGTGSTAPPPNYDDVHERPRAPQIRSSHGEESGSEPVSIPEGREMEDSMTFDTDGEESSDGSESTIDNEEDEDPTYRQTAVQSQATDSEPQSMIHPRRMSSQFGISDSNTKRENVNRVLMASVEESPMRSGMSGWGVDERRAQEHSNSNGDGSANHPSRRDRAQSHRRNQTAPSEISVSSMDGPELQARLRQMEELAKTLTRCVEETRQSFREAGIASPAQVFETDSSQTQVEAAHALQAGVSTDQSQDAPSTRSSRSQRVDHSETTSSSQLYHSESADSLSSIAKHVAFKEQVEQFSPVTTPGFSSVHSDGKQQNFFAFPSMSNTRNREASQSLKAHSNTKFYGEGLQGYNSDSFYDSSNQHARLVTSSQNDVSLPAPSLTSASSFEDSQHPSASFASSKARSQKSASNTKQKQEIRYPSKIPILSERKRQSGAFSYNATPIGANSSEEDDVDDLVIISTSSIPISNRNSYMYTKAKNQAHDSDSSSTRDAYLKMSSGMYTKAKYQAQAKVAVVSNIAQPKEIIIPRKPLAGGSVRMQGKDFTGRPTVDTTKETASSSPTTEHDRGAQPKLPAVGGKPGSLSRSNSLGRPISGLLSKKSSSNLNQNHQLPSRQDSTDKKSGKTPATPARGALWRLLRGVGVKSKEMQRTI